MGNGSVIRRGDVQRMSAGTGVRHSEFNASQQEPVHFLQIWLLPNRSGVEPGYAQRHFPEEERRGRLALLVSPDGREGSLNAHQDGSLYATLLGAGEGVRHPAAPSRQRYIHIAQGSARVNNMPLLAGDGVRIGGEAEVWIEGIRDTEALLFDLP